MLVSGVVVLVGGRRRLGEERGRRLGVRCSGIIFGDGCGVGACVKALVFNAGVMGVSWVFFGVWGCLGVLVGVFWAVGPGFLGGGGGGFACG